jgi:hypothetical protein
MKRIRTVTVVAAAWTALLVVSCGQPINLGEFEDLQKKVGMLEIQVRALEKRVDRLEKKPEPTPVEAPIASLPQATGKAKDVRCKEKDGVYYVTADEAKALKDDVGGVSATFRMLPAMEGDKILGMKLYAIRADSFPASCGLKNGDTATEINGMALASPDDVLEAVDLIAEKGEAVVRIMRSGQLVELTIMKSPPEK